MYWVVISCFLLAESWVWFIVSWFVSPSKLSSSLPLGLAPTIVGTRHKRETLC